MFNAGSTVIAAPREPTTTRRLRELLNPGHPLQKLPLTLNMLGRTLTFLVRLALQAMLVGTGLLASAIAVDELLAQPAFALRVGEFAASRRSGPVRCTPAAETQVPPAAPAVAAQATTH